MPLTKKQLPDRLRAQKTLRHFRPYINGAIIRRLLPMILIPRPIFFKSATDILRHCFSVFWKSCSTSHTTGLL